MFIEFSETLYNINHIKYLRKPMQTYQANTYSVYIRFEFEQDSTASESFETETDALKRYEELKQQLINLK